LSIYLSVFCNNLIVQGFVAASSRSNPQRNHDHSSLRTRERCSPSPPIFRIMVSPAFRKIGVGFLPAPTPGGVPVVMMSPLKSHRVYASTKLKRRSATDLPVSMCEADGLLHAVLCLFARLQDDLWVRLDMFTEHYQLGKLFRGPHILINFFSSYLLELAVKAPEYTTERNPLE